MPSVSLCGKSYSNRYVMNWLFAMTHKLANLLGLLSKPAVAYKPDCIRIKDWRTMPEGANDFEKSVKLAGKG